MFNNSLYKFTDRAFLRNYLHLNSYSHISSALYLLQYKHLCENISTNITPAPTQHHFGIIKVFRNKYVFFNGGKNRVTRSKNLQTTTITYYVFERTKRNNKDKKIPEISVY